jgi:hypothetical protein
MRERGFGPRSPQLAGAKYELAQVYFKQRKFKDAEAALKEALEINEQELGPQDASVEACLRAWRKCIERRIGMMRPQKPSRAPTTS